MRYSARLLGGALFLFTSTTLVAQAPPAPAPAAPAPAPQPPAATPPAAAPAAAPAATGDYFPMKAGAKWTYKVGEAIVTVKIAATDKDGTKVETEVNGKVVASEVLSVTPEGIVRTKINNSEIKPPVMILKLTGGKATKGDKWTVNSTVQGQTVKGDFTTSNDKESVTVPYGKYDAVVVEGGDFDIAGTKTAIKYYFVPGKGIVKQSYSIQGNEAVLELKEYAEGK